MRVGQIDILDLHLPMTLRPSVPISDEQLIRFSDHNKPYRFERNRDGEIIMMTPVGGIGGTHEQYVAATLFSWTEQTATGISFGSNTGFNLPDGSCLSPDAAWLSLVRWNALMPEQQAGFPPLCPEFLIEIRSRSDSRRLLEAKMQLWLDNGAQLAWLIDPIDQNAVLYSPSEPPVILSQPEEIAGSGPVAGFVLRTARLWQSH